VASTPATPCLGWETLHIDNSTGECDLGSNCSGGDHDRAIECISEPEDCEYCRALLCSGSNAVEHWDGTAECDLARGICRAPGHLEAESCSDVTDRPLAFNCGPHCASTPAG
jgi:hypothetical protein